MKKLIMIVAALLIGVLFISCNKEVQTDVPSLELKAKPVKLTMLVGDTMVITPQSPIIVGVGDSVLLTVEPALLCEWYNSHPQSASFYQPSWGLEPFSFYDDQCFLIGLSSSPPNNWGFITAGYTFPNGVRVNTTNTYQVVP